MRSNSRVIAAAITILLLLVVGPISTARSGLGQPETAVDSEENAPVGCSSEPLPEVIHLGEGAILKAGLVYLVKGPLAAIDATFAQQFWRETFKGTVHGVALVAPARDESWPPARGDGNANLQETSVLDLWGTFDTWQIVQGWRPPLVMFSSLDDPIDVASLGTIDAHWAVSVQVLDHLNHFYSDQNRHAWLYLVRQDASEVMLGQLEVADPAQMTVNVPEQGEIRARTHDSTVWWVQCVPPLAMTVTKSASPAQAPEPGGRVTFGIRVDNPGPMPLTLISLTDSVYGAIALETNPAIESTTCTLPQLLPVSSSYECSFTASVWGDPGDTETDTVTAVGRDSLGREVEAHATAEVTIVDTPSSIQVTKTAEPAHVPEPGADVVFSVTVQNTSAVDQVSIHSVIDDQFGDVGAHCSRPLPEELLPGETMTFVFSEFIGGQPGDSHTNVVTASGLDDDGNPVRDDDDAVVIVDDVPSSIQVIKTATPHWMYYPGGDVTFEFTVSNLSPVDAVTIDHLVDTAYGNLDGQGDCSLPRTLGVGGSFRCAIVQRVMGEPDTTHTNLVTASGTDDDGAPVSDDDVATVTIAAVPTSVKLRYLKVSAFHAEILVEWETEWERNNWGFNLYRSMTANADEAVLVHFQPAQGAGEFEGHYYLYKDQDVVRGQVYYYWLEDVDVVGSGPKLGPWSALIPYRVYMPLAVRNR